MVSTCRSPRSESSKKAKNVTNHWTDFSATPKSPISWSSLSASMCESVGSLSRPFAASRTLT